jgi:uncharacterized membrane protein
MTGPDHTSIQSPPGEKNYWLDDRQNVDKIFWVVIVVCVALMLVEPFYHKHPYFGIDGSFGFYGWFGFLACAGLVLVARALGRILGRREDYYRPGCDRGEDNG